MSTQQTLPDQLASARKGTGSKEPQTEEVDNKKRKAGPPRGSPPLVSRKRNETDNASASASASAPAPAPAPAPAREPDEELIAEYRCPITQELPMDPVVAEDGQCYDRSAIEEWFAKHTFGRVKSPMTNQVIGKKLVPALQMRNSLERLISKGILTGEAAEVWKERHDELKNLTSEWRTELEGAYKGEPGPMCSIGLCYREGHNGFKKDQSKAIDWLKRSAELDDPQAVCNMAIFYINGQGLQQDFPKGFFEMGRAAMLGSEHAAICAGNYYHTGSRFKSGGDAAQAARWYKSSRKATVQDSVDDFRKVRDDWLRKHGHSTEDP